MTFSIPNRIEPSATTVAAAPRPLPPDFQHPQSDRALCNCDARPRAIPDRGPFSIPNRIEPSATGGEVIIRLGLRVFQYPQSDRALCNSFPRGSNRRYTTSFQYPQSDRALCNSSTVQYCDAGLALSVSPIGSSPLQLKRVRKATTCEMCLSVSPIGSSPLQPVGTLIAALPRPTFSIPNRIEPSATWWSRW